VRRDGRKWGRLHETPRVTSAVGGAGRHGSTTIVVSNQHLRS
jgi:hypothetical protein